MRFGLLCGAILGLECLAVLAFGTDPHHILGGDGPEYRRYATNLVEHGVFSRADAPPYEPSVYRTPGYPVFLAGVQIAAGDSLLVFRLVQFALLGVLATIVWAIARRVADVRTGQIAALLCLTYLPFLWLTRFHLTEIVASVLVASIVLLLLHAARLWQYVLVGVLLGVTGLVRPIFALAVVPIFAAIVLMPSAARGRALSQAAAVLLGLVVALTPWTIRNHALTGDVMPFGGGGGISLLASAMQYQGTIGYRFDRAELDKLFTAAAPVITQARAEAQRDTSSVPLNVREELAVEKALRAQAIDVLEDLDVADALARLPRRSAYLWAVSDYPPEGSASFWHPIAQLEHFALLILAAVGMTIAIGRRPLRCGLSSSSPPIWLARILSFIRKVVTACRQDPR